jgi:asparagine synthase (glutamine-hydrolysing)
VCGIAGIVSANLVPLPEQPIADAMCKLIQHRGPDDQGIFSNASAQIGMRRLSIIDLAGGHQPIHNEDKTVWIVFNGEIYNFRELRSDLEARGHRFYTSSDTECIVHAYEEYGDACFTRLRGMFAIAVLDLRGGTQRLVLARDRLGKKPLYYTMDEYGRLAFASELKSLFGVPGFDPVTSKQATREYFAMGYVPGPATIYENVFKLPPAHYLVLEQGKVTTTKYWTLDFQPKWTASEPELEEQLMAELDEAVRVRLVSDVPFGAFLSGGLDSSVVAALMARHMSTPVKAFTIGFNEDAFNELPDARRVAQHIGAEHHEFVVTPDAVKLLDDLSWYFDEPFGDSSSLPTFLVSHMAAKHVKMVLSGDGGDEGFAGYERYQKYARLNSLASQSLGLAGVGLRAAGGSAKLFGRAMLGNRLTRVADRMALRFPERYLSGVALSTQADISPILSKDVAALDPYAQVRSHFLRGDIDDEMERVLSGDMASYLVDDILVKVDRTTMATSLEARAPLLDHKLLEFAARLPYNLKANSTGGKYLLKKVAAKLLPVDCLQKRKQGFAIPLAKWFCHEFKPLMHDVIADRAFRERGVFDVAGVENCYARHLAGEHDFSELLWLVLTYEMWARTFVDGRKHSKITPRAPMVVR